MVHVHAADIYDVIETQNIKLNEIIKENHRQGNFVKSRKKILDNF